MTQQCILSVWSLVYLLVRHRYMSSKANMTVKCCKKLRSVDNFQTTAYHDGCSCFVNTKKKMFRHLWLKIINAPMKLIKEMIGMLLPALVFLMNILIGQTIVLKINFAVKNYTQVLYTEYFPMSWYSPQIISNYLKCAVIDYLE